MAKILRDIGEQGILERLKPLLTRHTAGLPLGTGDDVAITDPTNQRLVWTTDTMIEGTHFRWWNHQLVTAENLGWKLAATNLSDLASKGATPYGALLSIGVPYNAEAADIESLFRGVDVALSCHGARLLGGDLVSSPLWMLTMSLTGTLSPDAPIAARHRATPGQSVYTSGWPGESGAGLAILENNIPEIDPVLVGRHLRPTPRIELGRELVRLCPDLAMLDLSDGIAIDAERVAAASDVAIVIEKSALPISPELNRTAGERALEFCLHGGEDYELLFCTAEEIPEQIAHTKVTRIGTVEEGEGLWIVRENGLRKRLTLDGFKHF